MEDDKPPRNVHISGSARFYRDAHWSWIPPTQLGPGAEHLGSKRGTYDAAPYNLQRQRPRPCSYSRRPGRREIPGEAITRTTDIESVSKFNENGVHIGPHTRRALPLPAMGVVKRLEEYFQKENEPNVAITGFLASNLGVETEDVRLWFYQSAGAGKNEHNLQNLRIDDHPPQVREGGFG